ncbi:Uu.00g084800.m01.CDS01 [Anthostomella pinea]|uniref:Splicing factor YJU2 n=1 Tax=Anthostomella pinea TaxID=933095 RepID=A0AAI8VLU8_9PEZI|nr:Uu.00g084800.m01.CDS01 [Anthostomella pinea]
MSERKVLTKYYPPDFDPSKVSRVRAPKKAGPKVQTVRLMAPFSMKCLQCGEYIYRGRKFNARKEVPPDEKYLGIQIFRFYIKCTRCSAEITFKTDPRNNDYACERGARRNTEPWKVGREETDEERLDRLEREEEERNAMVELEAKTVDAKREMAVADALDEIRTRNARVERADKDGIEVGVEMPLDSEADRLEREDAEAARRAFGFARMVDRMTDDVVEDGGVTTYTSASSSTSASASTSTLPSIAETNEAAHKSEAAQTASAVSTDMPPPSFKRVVKKKKNHAAALGIRKKPSLV